jgi:hypothetical protein
MERGGLPCIIGSCRRCRVINRQRERGECIDIKHTLMFHVCIHCADICIEGNWLAGWLARYSTGSFSFISSADPMAVFIRCDGRLDTVYYCY